MISVPFSKYHGCGNDFIIIDNRLLLTTLSEEQIAQLCHRRFGIGADGLILLQQNEGFDFEMLYYNSDGKEGSMCGNGGRCIVAFAHRLGIFENAARFLAYDGEHRAYIVKHSEYHTLVKLQMQDVKSIAMWGEGYILDTGSPHYVRFINNLADYDVVGEGRALRYSKHFAETDGINVNFVEISAPEQLFVRTYERGVEDETYSCGTGVTASALVYGNMYAQNHIFIKTLGGNLEVYFERNSPDQFYNIFLQAEVTHVFDGCFEI